MAGSALSKSRISLRPFLHFVAERLQIYMWLLGEEAMKNTILVTTDWPHDSEKERYAEAVDREEELRTSPSYFAPFILQGAKLTRFRGDETSARLVVADARRTEGIPLQIQRELVDQDLGLQMTQAGKLVATSVDEMIEFYNLTIKELQGNIKRLKRGKDSVEKRRDAEERLESYRSILANTKRDRRVLAVNIWKKLARGIRMVFQLRVQ